MLSKKVWLFLIISAIFAAVHTVAIYASLYWYYSWFDIVMHFWGGILVALGVQALATLRIFPCKPTYVTTILILVFLMVVWEIFEYAVGLYDPATHVFDTMKDIVVGFLGGTIGYILLRKKN